MQAVGVEMVGPAGQSGTISEKNWRKVAVAARNIVAGKSLPKNLGPEMSNSSPEVVKQAYCKKEGHLD